MSLIDKRLWRTRVFRLTMLYAASVCVIAGLLLGWLYWFGTAQLYAQIDTGLVSEARALARLQQREGRDVLLTAVMARGHTSDALVDVAGARYYLLLDAQGRPLGGDFVAWPVGAGALHDSTPGTISIPPSLLPSPGPDPVGDIRALTLSLPDGSRLLVAQALNEVEELKGRMLAASLGSIVVIITLASLGGALLGRRVLRHVDAVTRTARAVMDGELQGRMQPRSDGGDEFDELARVINAMIERIDQLIAAMRMTTVNVAHDLRSPLSRVRSRLELLQLRQPSLEEYAAGVADAIVETDRLMRSFRAILKLAEIESSLPDECLAPTDLSEVCNDLQELYVAAADDKQIAVECAVEPGVYVRGNRELLAQAVTNLLDNALKYTPGGGRVRLELARGDESVELTVSDDGPGIPASERLRVLEPFVRLDESRGTPGNGLGLSLVRAIAIRHVASLQLLDNHPGLRVVLRFPVPVELGGGPQR